MCVRHFHPIFQQSISAQVQGSANLQVCILKDVLQSPDDVIIRGKGLCLLRCLLDQIRLPSRHSHVDAALLLQEVEGIPDDAFKHLPGTICKAHAYLQISMQRSSLLAGSPALLLQAIEGMYMTCP